MKKIVVIGILMVVMIFGVVAYSYADTSVGGTVTVTAKVGPKLEMTLSTNAIDLLTVDPGSSNTGTVDVRVRSNKTYSITRAITNSSPGLVVSSAVAPPTSVARTPGAALVTWTDTLKGDVDWTADANAILTSSVLYTAAQ